jgi:DNA-binding beta-propeller fold protein YncE
MPSAPVRNRSLVLASVSTALVLSASAGAQTLIFADILNNADPQGNSIRQVNIDGSGLHTLVATGGGMRGVDVDRAGGKVYWTDVDNFVIRRANLNGTGQQDLVTMGLQFPAALRLDLSAGKISWGDATTEAIQRSNLDGTGVATPFASVPFFRGLAIDSAHGFMYWTTSDTSTTGRIFRGNLNGTGAQVVVQASGNPFKPGNIALDAAGGKIYWTDPVAHFVRRANLDGTIVQDLRGGAFANPTKGIALDLAGGVIYWGEDVFDADSGALIFGQIWKMNLDGTAQNLVVSGLGSVNDLVFVPSCVADFNHSGTVTIQDLFDFLAAWFAHAPSADINHSGTVTIQDLFDFLAAWFAGC